MKLYAWQPSGLGERSWFGELSWFAVAEDCKQARAAVEAEMARRLALPVDDPDRIVPDSFWGWGTDYYQLTITEPGGVVTNDNS